MKCEREKIRSGRYNSTIRYFLNEVTNRGANFNSVMVLMPIRRRMQLVLRASLHSKVFLHLDFNNRTLTAHYATKVVYLNYLKLKCFEKLKKKTFAAFLAKTKR